MDASSRLEAGYCDVPVSAPCVVLLPQAQTLEIYAFAPDKDNLTERMRRLSDVCERAKFDPKARGFAAVRGGTAAGPSGLGAARAPPGLAAPAAAGPTERSQRACWQ